MQKIIAWLKNDKEKELEELWQKANEIRKKTVGNEVHLRGLIEISNYCIRQCTYCGTNAKNTKVKRYRMSEEEIFRCAKQAEDFGYGTVVLQAGEDLGLTQEFITKVILKIKRETPLAITLSLGERTMQDFEKWKKAGADRYLLRFETSDIALYNLIHPPFKEKIKDEHTKTHPRIHILRKLRELGYEIGSGVMIGIPGQSYESLAKDILMFKELDLDMIGVGPYIPHPDTALGMGKIKICDQGIEQVPNTELMTYKVLALTRIMCAFANIPSTTALATLNKAKGRELGLMRGANVVMPNLTPLEYRKNYTIYPNKVCIHEDAVACNQCMKMRIELLNRTVGEGPGGRRRDVA